MPAATRLALSALVVLALVVESASADGREASEAALEVFEKSEVAYRAGQFAEAVRLLARAYELNPEPVLLYNMGRAYEGLGDFAHAVEVYQRYLVEEREVPDRPALERRLGTLRAAIAERERLEREVRSERRGPGAWPWIVAGGGALFVAVGAGAGVIALSKKSEADDRNLPQEDAARLHGQAEDYAVAANLGLIGGGAIAAAGVAWGLLTLPRRDGSKVTVSTRGTFVALTGTF